MFGLESFGSDPGRKKKLYISLRFLLVHILPGINDLLPGPRQMEELKIVTRFSKSIRNRTNRKKNPQIIIFSSSPKTSPFLAGLRESKRKEDCFADAWVGGGGPTCVTNTNRHN